jgi:hypothetical protein
VGLLLAALLSVTASRGITASTTTDQRRSVPIDQGTGTVTSKRIVNPRELAASSRHPHLATEKYSRAIKLVSNDVAVAQASASTTYPILSANFNGIAKYRPKSPPDPNVAVGTNEIVEVVSSRMQVYNKVGGFLCPFIDLPAFFGLGAGQTPFDPRILYDNVNNRFIVEESVVTTPAAAGDVTFVMAATTTGDACGPWISGYYQLNDEIPIGNILDQPVIGQDRNAFLFGGITSTETGSNRVPKAFAIPKSCVYDRNCVLTFDVFHPAHNVTPASSGGTPMISTALSYFVATVPNLGYELYAMTDSGGAHPTFGLQATISATSVIPLTRDGKQPGTTFPLHLQNAFYDTRIKSQLVNDGDRVWFAHQSMVAGHPGVRYGFIGVYNNTVLTNIATHSATSDDFNPSIAVALQGSSRVVYLNWAFTDANAGIPVTPTVAAIHVVTGDAPPGLNGRDVKLFATGGGITNIPAFGDYSATAIDPNSVLEVCAVSVQEYYDTAGSWVTRVSRFGDAGC